MREGIAFILSAPSGTGKSTLVSMLRAAFPQTGFSVSCTTRPPRPNEVDGKDYFFISNDDFEKMRVSGKFAEWAEVHGHFYGTPLAPIQTMLKAGTDVIFDIDVEGAAQLKASIPDAICIFIVPPSMKELEKRLRARGVNDEKNLELRLAAAEGELHEAFWYDRIIINDDLEAAFDQLKACYLAAGLTPAHKRQFLEQLLEEAQNYNG